MNKKIIIGSLVAVVILILVSFTGVVGYQNTKSSTIARASPLFAVRSSRAIDEESKDIACDYVGKGEEIILSIPKRDSEKILIQKFADSISKMDNNNFKRFLNLLINKIQEKNEYEDINEVINTFQQIRNNPLSIISGETNDNISSFSFEFTPTLCWFPGCLLYLIIMFIYTYLTYSTVCTFYPPFCT
jgi:hypothetical protein